MVSIGVGDISALCGDAFNESEQKHEWNWEWDEITVERQKDKLLAEARTE